MFDIDTFIADCRDAVDKDPTQKSSAEVVRRALSNPSDVLAALGERKEPGITPLYQSSDLTIINLAWKPLTTIPPHNHEMWAVIGIVRRQRQWDRWRPELREGLAHLVGLIMRRFCGEASAGFRRSFV
ncbi:hypothetical protein [Ruegeria sp. Ofav3-42]|uniref:hypothetical protein n=1 Tax=Ruegeria sp. Ofav3-42 TaxID=2917759 RepID=UPI001EF5D768|nr:hypothetical protein [Ruegeria sp. Ofav3-42]MCG7522827.1 hypothetical protein [Ruegeria sp. Ofav3-42]